VAGTRSTKTRAKTPKRARATKKTSERTRSSTKGARSRGATSAVGPLIPVRVRQLALLGLLLGSAYGTAALASFDPLDPGFSRTGLGDVHNVAGPVGAWVADVMFQVMGWGAWAVSALGVLAGLRLAGRPTGGWTRALAGGTLVWAAQCSLALLLPAAERVAPFPAGGLIGEGSAATLLDLVGPAGAWIVLIGAGMVGVTYAVRVDWERIFSRIAGHVEAAVPAVGRLGAVVGRKAAGRVVTAGANLRERIRTREASELDEEFEWGEEEDSLPPSVSEAADEAMDVDNAPNVAQPRASEAADFPFEPELGLPAARPTARPVELGIMGPAGLDEVYADAPQDRTLVAGRSLVEVEWVPTSHTSAGRGTYGEEARPSVGGGISSMPPALRRGYRPDVDDLAADAPVKMEGSRPEARGRAPISTPVVDAPEPQGARRTTPEVHVARPEVEAAAPPLRTGRPSVALPGDVPPLAAQAQDAPEPRSLRIARRRAGNAIQVDPDALVSGGSDDGGRLFIDLAERDGFELPHLGLLDTHERSVAQIDESALRVLGDTLESKLSDFGVDGNVVAIRPGPVITTFEYMPAPGIKLSKIASLSDDIAMALMAVRVRIVAPIPGKGVVGFEVPNKNRQIVWIRDILASENFRTKKRALPIVLGKNVEGKPEIEDLAKAPHLLVAGTTGSGKSVGVNAMLLSMLYTCTPEQLRLILIDPKMLEFELYQDIPHLLHPVVTDPALANAALKWACEEMDDRYRLLARWKTRNIASYNDKVELESKDWNERKARQFAPPDWPLEQPAPEPKKLPYIVIVIDELADLMMVAAKEVEINIARIAQKARAAGIHLVVATQRPEKQVVTGIIKSNMPSRIAFQVRSKLDGRIILDQSGAETLLGKGDMLFLPPATSDLVRCHGPFVADEEVRRVCDFLREQGEPNYEAQIRLDDAEGADLKEEDYDELYDQAVNFVLQERKASTSMIQRQFKIGYNRAARIIEVMEKEGLVAAADGARPRKVLVGNGAMGT
jgi:DNA segregation ATPase FtsK/SpoIIIE, S-DNA-T family